MDYNSKLTNRVSLPLAQIRNLRLKWTQVHQNVENKKNEKREDLQLAHLESMPLKSEAVLRADGVLSSINMLFLIK